MKSNELPHEIELVEMHGSRLYDKNYYVNHYVIKHTQEKVHKHNEFVQINYVASGNGFCEFEDDIFKFTQGSFFVIPPFVSHRIILAERLESVTICEVEFYMDYIFPPTHNVVDMQNYFDFISYGKNGEDECGKYVLNLTGVTREKIEGIMNEALYEYRNKEIGYEMMIRAHVLQLLTVLERGFSGEVYEKKGRIERNHSEIMKAISYIHQNYENDINLEQLSQLTNYASPYFSKLFKTVTSQNYLEYLNNYRIKKSMELLKTTNMRVIDVATSVGFGNVTNFNRVFKKLIGMTPIQYRKLN